MSALDNIRVVLCQTTHPGNIGAAARAMKTMGIRHLYLVNPSRFPDAEAVALASGAQDVLDSAVVCANLEQALADCVLAVGLTARSRDLSVPFLTVRDAAPKMIEEAAAHKMAIVFGTEMSGLTNQELGKCQMLARIPSDEEYGSLNLAAAVQVVCYELRIQALAESFVRENQFEFATLAEIEAFYQHLEVTLIQTEFLNPEQPKRLMLRLRRLFSRTRLEKEEVNILRGILSSFDSR
jgi:tRNA/rRNA methyltransferase